MNELKYWTDTLNARATDLGLEATVKAVQPAEGAGYVMHWVYETAETLVELGWNVEEAERNLRMLALQIQMGA